MPHSSRRLLLTTASALALSSASLAACGGDDASESAAPTTPAAAASQTQASFVTLAKAAIPAIDVGATLLDVRTKEEFDAGHAEPAMLFPLADLEAGKLPDLPKDTVIYVTCRTGNRAGIAADILNKAGFTKVTNIGGLTDWQQAGGPVTS